MPIKYDIDQKLFLTVPHSWVKHEYARREVKKESKFGGFIAHREVAREYQTPCEGTFDVEINIPEIINLVVRSAASTKSGKSQLLDKLIIAKVRRMSKGERKVTKEYPLGEGYVLVGEAGDVK